MSGKGARIYKSLEPVRIVVGSGYRVKMAPGDAGAQNGARHTGRTPSENTECPKVQNH